MSWSDRVINVEGSGLLGGGKFYNDGEGNKWFIQGNRMFQGARARASANFHSPFEVYLVDGGVVFSSDGNFLASEKINFPVGPGNYFSAEDPIQSRSPTSPLHFKVNVSYRLPERISPARGHCHASAPNPKRMRRNGPNLPAASQPLQSLVADYRKLFFSSDYSDVVFLFGQESVPAHRSILSARVPFFERLFASDMKEAATKTIPIEDCDIASFEQFLKFIYSAELPKDLEIIPETYLQQAEKYDMQDLKHCCSQAMIRNLVKENAVSTLMMADMFRCPELKAECFRKLSEWKTLLTEEDFQPLPKELLVELFRGS